MLSAVCVPNVVDTKCKYAERCYAECRLCWVSLLLSVVYAEGRLY
jgi:hypothetical protein